MGTVTKKDLIDRVATITGCKRAEVKKVVQRFLEMVVDELGNGKRLEFRDFGVFEPRERAARTAQNPKTLQRVTVPAKRTVKFKPGRILRGRLEVAPSSNGQAVTVEVTTRRSAGAAV